MKKLPAIRPAVFWYCYCINCAKGETFMQYEGDIYRPPSEAHSLIVQATIGCSHNRCTFCSMYREKDFRIRPVEDILADLTEMAEFHPGVQRIFLADGDALILPTKNLLAILSHIRILFPACTRVAVYASPRSILLKSGDELKELRAAGLGIAYLGLESGNDEVLRRICKGVTAGETITAGLRVKKAGILLSVTAISGIGGRELWREHATCTGEAFTEMKPDYIGLLTLMLEKGTPLFSQAAEGIFRTLSPDEIALETLIMLEHTDCEGSVFRSNHASNYVPLRGTLNRDRPVMIHALKDALEGRQAYREEYLRLL